MNQNQPTNDLPIDDAWAELLSAYHDGELTATEQTEVEARLADDVAAQQWLVELGSLGSLCQKAADARQWRDVSKQVLAEAERRKADLIDDRPLVASKTVASKIVASQADSRPLEPDGEFGLPFGRSSRGWVWAGVAAAAAIMIGYVDRPAQQPTQTIAQRASLANGQRAGQSSFTATPVSMEIDRMRQAVPGLLVVRVELSPEGRKQFVQSLARNGFGFESNPRPALPQELAAARRAGLLVEPLARGPLPSEENDDQLMFVSAEAPRYSRLIEELEKDSSIYRVEADPIVVNKSRSNQPLREPARGTIQRAVPPGAATPMPRVICFRMEIVPQISAAPKLKITQAPTIGAVPPKAKVGELSASQSKEEVVRGEEALPDTTIANTEGLAPSSSSSDLASREAARRQSGRVPVVFVVKMRIPEGAGAPR